MRGWARKAVWLGVSWLLCAIPAGARPETQPLSPQNRLAIVRVFAFEYATARQPLPASKRRGEGLEVGPTGQVNEAKLRQTLAKRGAAVHAGEIVQITAIEFRPKFILFEINGGGKRKKKWYERVQIGVGGGPVGGGPSVQTQPPPPGSTGTSAGSGSWILLNFPEGVPDLSAEDVKQKLAVVLDFSQRSAAVPWIETIPEEFRQAIKEKRVVVGMDAEMVLAARGRPDRKIRESKNGQEYEDWIYGNPPFVTFVTFVDDKVVAVKEFR